MARKRAPGKNSPQIRALNKQLRVIHAQIRTVEKQLVTAGTRATSQPLMRKLDRLVTERERVLRDWVRLVLPATADAGAKAAAIALGVEVATSRIARQAIREVQEAAFEEIAKSTAFIREDKKRLLRQIIKETTELHVKRGLSIPDSKRIIRARMKAIGLRAFVDKSGRSWKLDTYAEMVARTRTAQAYNVGTVVQSAVYGTTVFEVFDGLNDDICSAAAGTVVSADWAAANPIGHPNCTRAFGPLPGYGGKVAS